MVQVKSSVLFPPFLLATDGSPNARLAQKLLYPIAQTLPASNANGQALITVLTVQPSRSSRAQRRGSKKVSVAAPALKAFKSKTFENKTPEFSEPVSDGVIHLSDETDLPKAAETLAANASDDVPNDLSVAVQVRRGRPATEILNYARTIEAGLIAVGAHGTGGVRELLLGSVSSVVARYAPCSVLVARGSVTETAVSLHHILLVVNESQATQQAIAVTQQLVPVGLQRVTILFAQPPINADYLFGPFVAPNPSWQLNQSLREVRKEQSQRLLEQVKADLDLSQLDVQTLLQIGEPGPLICQTAQQQKVDLVVLGGNATRRALLSPLQNLRRKRQQESAQRPALQNTRLSATEDYTIHHSPCPVLLCRGS